MQRRHKQLDVKLQVAERRLNNHCKIEQVNPRMEERLNSLTGQL